MGYKKIFIFICLIICLFSIASVCASDLNETAVVTENQNDDLIKADNQESFGFTDEQNKNKSVGTFADLSNEIANSDGVLNLTRDYVRLNNDSDLIEINNNITIYGNNFTITGNSRWDLFHVNGEVILRDIYFVNCSINSSRNNNGFINWYGSNGALYNCHFINCSTISALRGGSVIEWGGNNGTMYNCDFINCSIYNSNSDWSASGGAIGWSGDNGTIYDCYFINCSTYARDSSGGTIYWGGDNGLISNSYFINSTSEANSILLTTGDYNYYTPPNSISNGGAIYWRGNNGSIFNCSFINSSSESTSTLKYKSGRVGFSSFTSLSSGGAIYWKGDNGSISECEFINSITTSKIVSNRNSQSNSNSYGGAIYWEGNSGLMSECMFINSITNSKANSSSNEMDSMKCNNEGGAIYWYGYDGNITNYTVDPVIGQIYIVNKLINSPFKSNMHIDIENDIKNNEIFLKFFINTGAGGLFSVYIDDNFVKFVSNNAKINVSNLNPGKHNITIKYRGTQNFEPVEYNDMFRKFAVYPIESDDMKIIYGFNKKFQAKFFDEYGEILANKYVLFIVNDEEYPVKTNDEGIAVLDVDLAEGEYNVTSVSLLDENTTNKLLIFHSVQAKNMIIEHGSNAKFKATFLDEAANPLSNTNIVFNVDGKNIMVKTDVNGIATLSNELSIGTHTITSINTITDEERTNKLVVVEDIDSIMTVETNDITYNQKSIVKVVIDSNYLNANVTIKVTGENGYEEIFTQNAAKTITKEITGLNASKYQVTVKYADKNSLTFDKNATFTVSKIDPIMNINVEDTVMGDTATLIIDIAQSTGLVELKIGTNNYEEHLTNGKIVKELSKFNIGENIVEIFYKGDNNFNPLIKTATFNVWNNIVLDTGSESEIMVGENYIIDIYNLDENVKERGLNLSIDGKTQDYELILVTEDDKCHVQLSFNIDLSAGVHTWKVNYFDLDNYINTFKSGEFSVIVPPQPDTYQFALITNKSVINIPFDKITWNVKTVLVYDEYLAEYYDDPYVNYTFSTFTLDNMDYVIITSSSNPSFASLAVPFNPNEYIEHDGIYYAVKDGVITDVIGYSDYNVYDNEHYRIVGSGYQTFSENADDVCYALVNGECYKITGTMGASTAMFNKAIQNVDYKIVNGKYYTLNGDLIENLLDESYGSDYAVIKGTLYDINGNIYTPHSTWTIGDVLINNNGELSKVVYGKDYNNSFTVADGKLYAVVGDSVGEVIDIDMGQSVENHTSENTTDVNETVDPKIDIPSLDNPSEDGNVAVNLPSDATGTVTLSVDGKDYVFDVVNGVANVKLPELSDGNHDYTITYSGDSKYSSFVTNGNMKVNNTKPEDVKPTPDVVIPPLDEPSEDGSVVISLPSDATGIVTLTINGKEYYFAVVKGVANVIIPDLGEGDYPYTITYSGDSKYSSFTNNGTLNKAAPAVDPVITASNVKVTYATGKYYTIKVYGTDGKLADGAKVVIKVKGKTFKTLTTTNGVAKFKVTNVPGTYKMTITSLGKSVTKTLTVKHLVTLKSVTVKKSAKKLTLQATLGKVNGKYLKNKKITFKFNGKKYTAKTDKKGVAKVTIKSTVLKKLKVGKKVTYQATYSKDTVKKTVKVKM